MLFLLLSLRNVIHQMCGEMEEDIQRITVYVQVTGFMYLAVQEYVCV